MLAREWPWNSRFGPYCTVVAIGKLLLKRTLAYESKYQFFKKRKTMQ